MPKTYPEDEPGHIEFIARGVAIDLRTGSPRVLLCRSRKRGYSYLPGGHVEFGETAAQALAREILEEMGLPCQVGSLLQVHECAFHDGKMQRHEVNLLFHVKHLGPAGAPLPDPAPSAEPHIAFDWVPLDRVGSIDLRPARAGTWLTTHAAALAAGGLPPFESVADIDQ
ncbi:MAG: NUDIX domain-containing protein [Phycisphaeraceae bacterium]|nr:NUDIX domain-containing protein [Phycisphaeraceae bacterium]